MDPLNRVAAGPGGCWIWTGHANNRGYGVGWHDGRPMLTHRISYLLHVGPIPEGYTIDHVWERGCTSKRCVRPDHLEAVTRRENLLRGNAPPALHARKTHCKENHPLSGDNLRITVDKQGRTGRRCKACHAAAENRRRRSRGVEERPLTRKRPYPT